MRTILAFCAAASLAACGGGGGIGATAPQQQQQPNPPSQGQSNLVTPQFTLVIPNKAGSATRRIPQYVNGTSTLSVAITLVSNNGTPTTVNQPTIVTNVNGARGTSCTTGCMVSGPPSPPGTDRFTVTTYDATNSTGSALAGNVLSTATKDFTIVAGSPNTGLTIVLFGVVNQFAISGVPTPLAGTTPGPTTLTVAVEDADGGTITGTYGDNSTGAGYINNRTSNGTPVTVTINETNANGASLVAGGSATQNTTTSVTLHGSSDSVALQSGGLAENAKTITAAATGATQSTAGFQPTLQAITPSAGTEIDLYVDSTTGGTGSSGTQAFTEPGFTGAPYDQTFSAAFTMTSGYSTPCSQIATIVQGNGANGGSFTATAPAAATPPAAGSCDLAVNDGVTQAGHTSTAAVKVTYTTSSAGTSSKRRKN